MPIYQISIKKIEKEMVEKREYLGKEDPEADEDGYRRWEEKEEISREVYNQRIESGIFDVKKVIDAFNQ